MITLPSIAPIIPQPDVGFKLGERPVKQIIVSYFQKFNRSKILSIAQELGVGVAYFRIPGSYIAQKEIIEKMIATPELLDKKAWYYIPPGQSVVPLEFKQVPRKETAIDEYHEYEIYLYCFSTINAECNSPRVSAGMTLDAFQSAFQHEVRRFIEGALQAARGVFQLIKSHGGPILSTLELDIDNENLCLVLRDTIFPQYTHNSIIKYRIQEKPVESQYIAPHIATRRSCTN